MFGYVKAAALSSAMLSMFVVAGCCDPLIPKQPVEAPPPVVQAPPPAPEPVQPPASEPAPPPPPPAALPPAVTKAIQELSEKYPGLFKFDKNKGLLYFSSDALFDSGSAVVKSEPKAALGKLATILTEDEARDRRLIIIGHADADRVVKPSTIEALKKLGKSTDNMGLSQARAEAVAAVLQAGGIDASRMTTSGKGDTEPVADNRSPEGKARNRRVEVYVTPAKPAS